MKFVREFMFHFHLEIAWLGHIELFYSTSGENSNQFFISKSNQQYFNFNDTSFNQPLLFLLHCLSYYTQTQSYSDFIPIFLLSNHVNFCLLTIFFNKDYSYVLHICQKELSYSS